MNHRRLDCALDNKALGVLDNALDADAASDDQGTPLGRIAGGGTVYGKAWSRG
jgi:hypothetical protein